MHHSGDLQHLLDVNNIKHDREVITVLQEGETLKMEEHNTIKFWIGMLGFMKWAIIVPGSAGVLGYLL